MISLGRFVEEHHEALESDLITSAGIELSDVGGSLSWGAFASFIKNLDTDSALWRSTHLDIAEWGTVLRTNIILADIFDVLAQINANICGGFSHRKPPRVKPYPRPWATKNKDRHIGKGALPRDELRKWIKNYRKKGG